jgi:hypothetical protein
MHALNGSNNQNLKTLRDAKNLRKDDGCFHNGVEDWRRNEWVGGSSPSSIDDDLLVAWEFKLQLQKEDETLEHYGS